MYMFRMSLNTFIASINLFLADVWIHCFRKFLFFLSAWSLTCNVIRAEEISQNLCYYIVAIYFCHIWTMLLVKQRRGPCHWSPFHHIANVMEISSGSHPDSDEVIAPKFCTCHNSCAVVACAKICSNFVVTNGTTAELLFFWILILHLFSF